MSAKMTGAMLKELKRRVRALPKDFRVAFYEISKYLWQFAADGAGVPDMQADILDMFEAGARDGKDVLDIVGRDVIGFCDGLLGAVPEHTWIGRMKAGLNQNILKKLGRKSERGG